MRKTAVALTLGLLLGACGGGASPTPAPATSSPAEQPPPTTPAEGTTPPETTPPAEATTPPPEEGTTVTASRSELGTILTDAEGRTLYVFLNDRGGESTCYGECAQNWPALLAQGQPRAGQGVDPSLLGTVRRRGGEVQVTYDGQPLYHFAGDQGPGDTNGQGVGGVWFVVSPEGRPVQG